MLIQDQIKKSLDQRTFNTRSVVAYILFGAIILVFVLFGFPGRRATMGRGFVAEVNGEIISGADLKEEVNQLERFYSQMFGGNFGMKGQMQMLENQAVENLITRELLSQEANKAGFLVSDKEVSDFIVGIPNFQTRGRFDKDLYFDYVQRLGSKTGDFENKIRRDAQRMRVKRVFDAVDTGLTMQASKDAEIAALKFNVRFAKMDREILAKSVQVPAAQIQDYVKNPDNLKKIEVDYESHKGDLYSSPEQVQAQHILIKAKDGDADSENKARTKIMDLRVHAAKQDFALLAKSNSEDEGSRTKGGDLGYFGRGQMVPAFEAAAFNAKVGEIVGPVKTNFGYHLIKVLNKKAGSTRTLEDVKNEIARKLIAETQLDEQFQKLEEALSKKNGDEVEAQLKSWNVAWDETGDFDLQTETIPKLTGGQSLKDAVWSLGESGQWLDHLVREGSVRYVLRMKEIKKNEVAKLDTKSSSPAGAGILFESWLEHMRETNKVLRGESLSKGQPESEQD